MISSNTDNNEELLRVYRVLSLYYIENKKQAEIAKITNQSVATVNRLIKLGKDMGMVEITIRSPFETSAELSKKLVEKTSLQRAEIAPTVSLENGPNLRSAGRSAAAMLLEHLQDGLVIAITGGKGVSALIDALDVHRKYDVTVVPLTGGVQGKHYTDVNHLSTLLAEKLGGTANLIHVPMFASSENEQQMLMEVQSCRETFNLARKADIAIVGVGSIHTDTASYFDLTPSARQDREAIQESGSEAEFVAHLLDRNGEITEYSMNKKLVSLKPNEVKEIPFSFSVATGKDKIDPICSVLHGEYLKSIVTDERTASDILSRYCDIAPGEAE